MGSEAGIFHADESQMVNNVMKLDDVRVRAIMVPRQDIYVIDSLEPNNQQRKKLKTARIPKSSFVKAVLNRYLAY